jgi:LAO/AO transport system kinase
MAAKDSQNKNSSGVNPSFSLPPRKSKPISYYLEGLKNQDRYILSECITLLESNQSEKRKLAESILSEVHDQNKNTIRIGITGTPGVGKSTFIESFGMFLIAQGFRPAILAIDPSSQKTKGSILGDKTRMEALSNHPDAYIRPTATGNVLGGTALRTKEAIQVCEAAAFNIIIVETVGIGQSETEVDNITDVNLLLLQPGAGDDLQGIKRGVVENADVFIINKADGNQLELAKSTKNAYQNAISLFHHHIPEWKTPILLCSSTENQGMEDVFKQVNAYIELLKEVGGFDSQRMEQEILWFKNQASRLIESLVFANSDIDQKYNSLLETLQSKHINTTSALNQFEDLLVQILHLKK